MSGKKVLEAKNIFDIFFKPCPSRRRSIVVKEIRKRSHLNFLNAISAATVIGSIVGLIGGA